MVGGFVAATLLVLLPGCSTPSPAESIEAVPTEAEPIEPEPIEAAHDEREPVEPFPGITVRRAPPAVTVLAWVCLDAGWLEQIACSAGTREHEALLVPQAQPSLIHAALLMAGFEPGAPGSWRLEGDDLRFQPPTGSAVEILVRYDRPDGTGGTVSIEEPIRRWIRDHQGRRPFPDDPWIFGGSRLVADPGGEGERYLADLTGSVVGLVTFGDEILGFAHVFADETAVHAAEWEADPERVPPIGTEVELIIVPADPLATR